MTGSFMSILSHLTLCIAVLAAILGGASTSVAAQPAADAPALPQGVAANWWSAAQENIRRSEYQVTWQAPVAAYQAPNRAQNLRTTFTEAGIWLTPRTPTLAGAEPGWGWGLTLSGYGYAGNLQPPAPARLRTEGNRFEFQRGDLTEWYINAERGLEQGFTLAAPPQSGQADPSSPIIFELTLSGDLTPQLSADGAAIEFTTPGGVTVLRYADLTAYDADGVTQPARMEVTDTHTLRLFVSPSVDALYPLTIDPLATTPAWTAESDQADALFGNSVASAGDVNGDGYSDVIVGALAYDNGQSDEGRAFVYHGGANGLSTTPAWTAESDQADALFGYSVASAGDVNGDGYSDVIIGARYYDNGQSNEGRAFVYYGGASGLATTPAWTAERDQAEANFGGSVASAGDVNGDGYSDVIVGAPRYDNGQSNEGRAFIYPGGASGLSTTPAWMAESDQADTWFGYSVASAGDVNGDGYSDVIVGAYFYDNGESNEGRAYVYHGGASGLSATPAWTAESDQAGAGFGYSVASAGDVNGDGYGDVIVGAPSYGNGQSDEGRTFVYHGGASGLSTTPAWMAESDQTEANFGGSVASAGDVNGDGYSDVIVSASNYDNGQSDEGRAFIYHGGTSGLATTPAWMAESDQADAWFGRSVASAGDVNGDGYSDVIVGAPYYDNDQSNEGRAFIYPGGASGLATTPGWTAESDQVFALFGYSVASAGDVNGDGYSDVIVGAYFYDNGESNEGRAYVYHGGASGLATTPAWTGESDQASARFGNSVASAGDVNGDGYSDVIVGAPYYDNGQSDEGRAYVYHGGVSGLSATPAWTAESDQASAYFGNSVASAGDVNGDGYSDVIVGAHFYSNGQSNEGRGYVYHGGASGLSVTPAWTGESDQADARFGVSVASAGDVNGDGYSDVIVGAYVYDNGQGDEGRAFVYHGGASGLITTPAWMAESDQGNAVFGYSVASAGDVNGDGYSDVIVGARYYDNGQIDEGRAFVYHGGASGLATTPAWTGESDQANAEFAYSVASAGDVNGDGYSDVIVGARYYDNGQIDEGRAYVYHGGASGLATTPAWTGESDQASACFGWSVASAGDVNGDGYSDVIVGAYFYSNGQTYEGRAFVYYGNGGAGLSLRPRQRRSDGSAPIAQLGKSDSGTGFQLLLVGRMPLGREDVRLQWQVAPLGVSLTAANVIRGVSAAWTDVMTGGVTLTETVTGLQPGMVYHWRVRLLYRPGNLLGQPASRWIYGQSNGANETDLRAGGICSRQSGAFSSGSTWIGGVAPGGSDWACITAAHTVTLDVPAAVDGLYIDPGGALDLATHAFTVESGVTNHGTISQTQTVNNAGVEFLHLQNSAGAVTHYRGVKIDATANTQNLGAVTLTLRELNSGEYCTTTGAASPVYARRCYTIVPATSPTAPVGLRLYARSADQLSSISASDLAVYRFTGSWNQLANRVTGSDGGAYSYAEGDTPGFSAFLLGQVDNAPTAITLRAFTAQSTAPGVGLLFLAGLLWGSVGLYLWRRRS